jgi:hypothetical protein
VLLPRPAEPAAASASDPEAEAEVHVDEVHDLEDAPADNRTGIDRLAEAFPGAELLEEEAHE